MRTEKSLEERWANPRVRVLVPFSARPVSPGRYVPETLVDLARAKRLRKDPVASARVDKPLEGNGPSLANRGAPGRGNRNRGAVAILEGDLGHLHTVEHGCASLLRLVENQFVGLGPYL